MIQLKRLSFIALCVLSGALNAAPLNLFDSSRERTIPVEVYEPEAGSGCTAHDRCPVAIISAGYGVAHTRYRFIARAYLDLGYLVVAVRHELPGDPPLSVSGDLYETRKENWSRGAQSLRVVRRTLKDRFPRFDFDRVTLVGHSNGGDISAWLANHDPDIVSALVTLDHRRVALPRDQALPVLSFRAGDFPADAGVIPDSEEQEALGMCIIELPKARHNDMSDEGPEWLRRRIYNAILSYTSGQSFCSELKKANKLLDMDSLMPAGD